MDSRFFTIDPLKITSDLLLLLETEFHDKFEIKHFTTNELIFKEGQFNKYLYILLEGTIELAKFDKFDKHVKVDWIRPGSMFGILSFTLGRPALTSARAKTDSKVLLIGLASFERIRRESRVFYDLIGQLYMQNLIERYVHVVSIHMELDEMNTKIEAERNTLKKTLIELEASQGRLVNQEKMAILGQLVAGFAHEVNNPASALISSLDFLSSGLPDQIKKIPSLKIPAEDVFRWGLEQEPVSTLKTRELTKKMEADYPEMDRTWVRKITQLSISAQDEIKKHFHKELKKGEMEPLNELIRLIELGVAFKGMKLSAKRIAELVQSMKNYARQGDSQVEECDIRNGLHDTMLILSNRLKKRSLILELDEVSKVNAVVGELNQVWTNIIINACDATEDGSKLKISCGELSGLIWVRFEDDGPGVPDSIRDKIFEANFTTKNSSGHFGLGLGLAITHQIVKKNNGEIEVERSSELGGACFTVWLPVV
jgi:signal transduction histidine kinase